MMKRSNKIFNSALVGVLLILLVNSLVVLNLFNVSDFVSISKKVFLLIILLIVFFTIILNILFISGYAFRKSNIRKILVVVSIIFSLLLSVSLYYTTRINRGLDAIIDLSDEELTELVFVSLDENKTVDNLLNENVIAYVEGDDKFNDSINEEIALYSNAINIEKFDSYDEMLTTFLQEKTIDIVILPRAFTRYVEEFPETTKNLLLNANVFHRFNIGVLSDVSREVEVLKEPFTILIMGVNEGLADSIILVTFNPKTLHATMTSIARDSYVPIACYSGQASDKLNHSRGRSRQCMIDTIENYLDVDIDFYFEADFYALVKIVDALGGLELESPMDLDFPLLDEHDPSKREHIYIPEGKSLMNGKQVITFARIRHAFASGDFQRQRNQQYIIQELVKKLIDESKSKPETLINVLEAAGDNITMNLSMNNHISPLLGYAINNAFSSPVKPADTFTLQSSQISGEPGYAGPMSVILPYVRSVEDNKVIIKNNLNTDIPNPEHKEFSFSINKPHEFAINTNPNRYYFTETMGQLNPPVQETTLNVPDFNQMTLNQIKAWASNLGITLKINVINETSPSYNPNFADGQVIYQSHLGNYNNFPLSIDLSIVILENDPSTNVAPEEEEGPEDVIIDNDQTTDENETPNQDEGSAEPTD